MRAWIAVTFCLGVSCGSAPSEPPPKDVPKVDPKLLGRWTMVRSFSGMRETTEDPPRTEYEFKSDGTWIMRRDGKDYVGGPGKFMTDTTTNPAHIDMIRDPNDSKNRQVSQSIYQIESETLTICMPGRGDGRPTKFETSRDGFLTTWKRAKKE